MGSSHRLLDDPSSAFAFPHHDLDNLDLFLPPLPPHHQLLDPSSFPFPPVASLDLIARHEAKSTAEDAIRKILQKDWIFRGRGGVHCEESSTGCTMWSALILLPCNVLTTWRSSFPMKAFAMGNEKRKAKELSPQYAAMLIQLSFRAHLIRRSQVLCCLRELVVAKAKFKGLRSLFYNISYRRRIAHDHEERHRFSEKIIVLLLTVEAMEGPDHMVRTAKKSMLEELQDMLAIMDPQPHGGLIPSKKTAGVNNAIKVINMGKVTRWDSSSSFMISDNVGAEEAITVVAFEGNSESEAIAGKY